MDSIQCAVVLAKFERFEWEVEKRQQVAALYAKLLAPLADRVVPPVVRSDRTSAYAQFTVQVPDRASIHAILREAGVSSAIHYPVPIHRQPAYSALATYPAMRVSERLAEHVLSLPMHADLDNQTQRNVVEALADAILAKA